MKGQFTRFWPGWNDLEPSVIVPLHKQYFLPGNVVKANRGLFHEYDRKASIAGQSAVGSLWRLPQEGSPRSNELSGLGGCHCRWSQCVSHDSGTRKSLAQPSFSWASSVLRS